MRRRAKVNSYELVQFFTFSMYFLWFYDYFLTFGDEVQYPWVFRRRCQLLTVVQINYAWSGRKSRGEFPPPRLISNGSRVTRQCSRCSLLYGTSNKISSCNGLDVTIEQVHSPCARTLQGHHHILSQKACESRPAMRRRPYAHENFHSCAFPPTLCVMYPHRRSSPLYTTRQLSTHYMGISPLHDDCHCYRSDNGCVEL